MTSIEVIVPIFAVFAGIGVGWVLCSVLTPSTEERHIEAMERGQKAFSDSTARILKGANEKIHLAQKDHEVSLRRLEQAFKQERQAWDREREAMAAVNAQYFARIETLEAGRNGSYPESDRPAEERDDLAVQYRANVALGEGTTWEKQVARLMEAGWKRAKAEQYLRGELPDEEIPELGERLDSIIQESTGLP